MSVFFFILGFVQSQFASDSSLWWCEKKGIEHKKKKCVFFRFNKSVWKVFFSCGSFFFSQNRDLLSGKRPKNQINKWARKPHEEKKTTTINIYKSHAAHTVAAKKCTKLFSLLFEHINISINPTNHFRNEEERNSNRKKNISGCASNFFFWKISMVETVVHASKWWVCWHFIAASKNKRGFDVSHLVRDAFHAPWIKVFFFSRSLVHFSVLIVHLYSFRCDSVQVFALLCRAVLFFCLIQLFVLLRMFNGTKTPLWRQKG